MAVLPGILVDRSHQEDLLQSLHFQTPYSVESELGSDSPCPPASSPSEDGLGLGRQEMSSGNFRVRRLTVVDILGPVLLQELPGWS